MHSVHLGLGTNLGHRAANLRAAIKALSEKIHLDSLSGVWETAPLYVPDQPAFLNMAASGVTDLAPLDLLDRLKDLEAGLGRVASIRFGPRLIDIDILFHGETVMGCERLTLPHPRLTERRFALAPLAEIAPDLRHPTLGASVTELLAALPEDGAVRRLGPLDSL